MESNVFLLKKLVLSIIIVMVSLSVNGQVTIEMKKEGNVYKLPGKVNGLELEFIFDTGASNVYLSLAEALFMIKNGYLQEDDIKGTSYSQIANGEIVENTNVLLKRVEIGGVVITNVTAAISHNLNAPLLFGQSAIQKLGPIQLDGNKLIIKRGRDFASEKEVLDCLNKAYQLIEAGNYEEAIYILEERIKCLTVSELKSRFYGELALAYNRVGKKERAVEYAHLGLGEYPMNEILSYNLGFFLYEIHKFKQAKRAFEQHIYKFKDKSDKNNDMLAAAYCYLGSIQFDYGEFIDAENSYLSALNINKTSIPYMGLGEVYYAQKKFGKAIENYEKGIAYEPHRLSNINKYMKLANCYIYMKNMEMAKSCWQRCIEAVGTNVELIQMALLSDEEGKDEKLENDLISYLYCADMSHLFLGRYADNEYEMISHYESILGAEELFEIGDYIPLIYAYEKVGNGEKANEILEKGLNKFPNNPDLLFLRSLNKDDVDESRIADYDKILKQEKEYEPICFDYATVYNNLAWTYCCLKRYEEGLAYSLKSVKMEPKHAYSWETLGELYFFLERYEDCIEAMTRSLSLNDEKRNKSALIFRGKAYLKLGKIKQGQRDLKEVENIL